MVENTVSINKQEELNLQIFKQTAKEQGIDPNKVYGTGVAREFVPEYMKGDICERPERNSRPNSWGNNGGFTDDGIIMDSNSKKPNSGSPANDGGSLSGPFENNFDSSSYSAESSSNNNDIDDIDYPNTIFGRMANCFLDFLGLGFRFCEGSGSGGSETNLQCGPSPSPIEAERKCEEAEQTLGGGGILLINSDISHPSNNPPPYMVDPFYPFD